MKISLLPAARPGTGEIVLQQRKPHRQAQRTGAGLACACSSPHVCPETLSWSGEKTVQSFRKVGRSTAPFSSGRGLAHRRPSGSCGSTPPNRTCQRRNQTASKRKWTFKSRDSAEEWLAQRIATNRGDHPSNNSVSHHCFAGVAWVAPTCSERQKCHASLQPVYKPKSEIFEGGTSAKMVFTLEFNMTLLALGPAQKVKGKGSKPTKKCNKRGGPPLHSGAFQHRFLSAAEGGPLHWWNPPVGLNSCTVPNTCSLRSCGRFSEHGNHQKNEIFQGGNPNKTGFHPCASGALTQGHDWSGARPKRPQKHCTQTGVSPHRNNVFQHCFVLKGKGSKPTKNATNRGVHPLTTVLSSTALESAAKGGPLDICTHLPLKDHDACPTKEFTCIPLYVQRFYIF